MRRVLNLYRSSVGKKVFMAATGIVLLLFVIGHMAGNLKIYAGPEKYNAYAAFLRDMGAPMFGHTQLLWLVRAVLVAAAVSHILTAAQLTLMSYRAREAPYQMNRRISLSYASYTMRWGGVVVLAFVVYHLMHLTWGNVHPRFVPGSVYHNVVSGFQAWPVSAAYMGAMLPLGLHIYHGLWSAFQTLGVNNPRYNRWRRPVAAGLALIIVLGNISIPIAVLTGRLQLSALFHK